MLKIQMNGVIYEIDHTNNISEFVAINQATGQSVSDPNILAGLFATGRQIDFLQKALNPINGFLHDLSKGAIEEQQALDRIFLWEGAKFLLEKVSSFFVDLYFGKISKAEFLLDLNGVTAQLDLGTAMTKNMLLLAIIDSYLVQAEQHISIASTSNGWLQLEQSGAVIDATEVETTTSLALSAAELFLLRTQQIDASEITQSDGFIYDYAAFWAKLVARILPGYEILSNLKWGVNQAVDLNQIANLIEVIGTNVETSTMFDQEDLNQILAAFVARENNLPVSDTRIDTPIPSLSSFSYMTSSVTTLSDGGFVVTYGSFGKEGPSTISSGIIGQRYDSSGNAQGSEFRINSFIGGNQYDASVTALANGGFVVTWVSNIQDDDGSSGIYGQRYDANGNPQGLEFRINSYTTHEQLSPSVASLNNGGFLVTWSSFGQVGGNPQASGYDIFSRFYDANGNAQGIEFRVNSHTGDNQQESSVATLSNGGFVVIWETLNQFNHYDIYGQRYDASGKIQSTEFRVNSYTESGQIEPSISALTDGGFVVTWTSYDYTQEAGWNNGIFGQRYDANGIPQGIEFHVDTYTKGDQLNSKVTGLKNGGFVVILAFQWSGLS